MRVAFALSALIIAASPLAVSARDYPWCARTSSNGFNGDCSFTSYQQCQATVSGQAGECLANPRLAAQHGGGNHAGYRN
jgi:hypothetical protein